MNLGNLGRQTIAAPIAALTLVAGGGIALAASGGADPAPQAAEHRPAAKPTAEPTVKPTKDPKDETSNASPSPSLTGLCKAYRAGGYASSTKNGRVNPAWSALESAAGGAGDVEEFCDATLAADAADKAAKKAKGADDVDDADDLKGDKPAKDPKPAKPHQGGNDDDADVIDNDGGGDVDLDDDAGDVDNDDADDADSDDEGEGGSRGSGHDKD